MTETILLHELAIGYQAKGHQKVVAGPLTAALREGELTCLLGQNGIGKSTLLRTLSAFQPKLGGSIQLLGRELSDYSQQLLSRSIGVVLTEKPDIQHMTVDDLVGLGRSPYTGFWGTLTADDDRVVTEAIEMVGIAPLRHRMVHTLSDGERQKVMIAKALAQQTPVIILDEPTAFLDFASKVETMQLLHRLATAQHKTIFLSTHDVELALQLADSLWLMEPQGLSVGTPATLAQQGALSRFLEHDGIRFDTETLTIHVRQ